MEIFQTIWTALTTENEFLSILIVVPRTFLEIFLGMLISTTLLNISTNAKNKMQYVLLMSSLSIISSILVPNPFRSFINLFLMILCIKLLFKTTIIKSIFSVVIFILINVLCESIIIKVCMYYFNLDTETLSSIPIYRFILTLGIQLLVLLLYLFVKYFKVQISLYENMSKKSKIIFLINIFLAIIAISIQFLITGFYLDKLPIYIVILSNLSLIAYFLLSIYSLTKTTQLELTTLNLEQEKENNRILKSLQDDLRGFRHDFSNIMCTIGGFVQVKDMEGMEKYYSQIQKDVTKINNLGALNPESINNPAVFTLIASKYSKALELGIEMNINVFLNLNTLNMKIYEFTRALGILLDNAIEAAKECDEKVINLEIRKESKRNRQILLIENTYNNKDVDTEKIYDKNFSTKQGNSGLGLWEIRQILKKNTNLNLFTSKNNKFFKQQLEMYDM